jgi:uncharacterized membrane protein YfcA
MMALPASSVVALAALIFAVALIYSSVGHGGASGYLLVLSLMAVQPQAMASSALILNVVVSSIGFVVFRRAGYFSWRRIWPFLLLSVPASFLGGALRISMPMYQLLLGLALTGAALRLAIGLHPDKATTRLSQPAIPTAVFVGAIIGFLSGLVGIGGGVFLSPLLLLCRWANPKEAAASSALFILLNSLAGLGGKLFQGVNITAVPIALLVAAIAGGLIGTSMGARILPMTTVRRVLAVVLFAAAIKLLYTALSVPLISM